MPLKIKTIFIFAFDENSRWGGSYILCYHRTHAYVYDKNYDYKTQNMIIIGVIYWKSIFLNISNMCTVRVQLIYYILKCCIVFFVFKNRDFIKFTFKNNPI